MISMTRNCSSRYFIGLFKQSMDSPSNNFIFYMKDYPYLIRHIKSILNFEMMFIYESLLVIVLFFNQ